MLDADSPTRNAEDEDEEGRGGAKPPSSYVCMTTKPSTVHTLSNLLPEMKAEMMKKGNGPPEYMEFYTVDKETGKPADEPVLSMKAETQPKPKYTMKFTGEAPLDILSVLAQPSTKPGGVQRVTDPNHGDLIDSLNMTLPDLTDSLTHVIASRLAEKNGDRYRDEHDGEEDGSDFDFSFLPPQPSPAGHYRYKAVNDGFVVDAQRQRLDGLDLQETYLVEKAEEAAKEPPPRRHLSFQDATRKTLSQLRAMSKPAIKQNLIEYWKHYRKMVLLQVNIMQRQWDKTLDAVRANQRADDQYKDPKVFAKKEKAVAALNKKLVKKKLDPIPDEWDVRPKIKRMLLREALNMRKAAHHAAVQEWRTDYEKYKTFADAAIKRGKPIPEATHGPRPLFTPILDKVAMEKVVQLGHEREVEQRVADEFAKEEAEATKKSK